MPITLSFAFFDQGFKQMLIFQFFLLNFFIYFRKYLLVDPNELEEKCMDGKLVIGMNRHREICTMQLSGSMLLLKDQVNKNLKFYLCDLNFFFR